MRGVGNRHSCKTRDSSLPSKKGAQCEPDGEESLKKGKNVGFQRSLFSDEISPLRAFGAKCKKLAGFARMIPRAVCAFCFFPDSLFL